MTSLAVAFPGDTLIVQPWPDTVVDPTGHDPRSPYVEQFWLAILGPSTTWLLRYFAAMFDRWPDGFEINLDDTARSIGLVNQTGRGSPFARALPAPLQTAHEAWAATPSDDEAAKRRRARRLARALLELGEDPPTIEWQLRQWRFHPGVCADAVRWARQERAGIGAA
jgi:hypothetical protein